AFVLAGTDEDRGVGIVGLELASHDLAAEMDPVLQAVAADLRLQLFKVTRNADVEAADQVEMCVLAEITEVIGQGADQVELALVRRHAAHEQEVRPIT